MNSPSTPIKQKLGAAASNSMQTLTSSSSSKSTSLLAVDWKKILHEQHQRLWAKHQQDLDLLDDIKSYVKLRLSIERDYCQSLAKLSKQHSASIVKKFVLLDSRLESDPSSAKATGNKSDSGANINSSSNNNNNNNSANFSSNAEHANEYSESKIQKRHKSNSNSRSEPQGPCTLYKTWSEHITKLNGISKYRLEQYEQLLLINDKLKDLRQHKSVVGKKSLDNYLKKSQEYLLQSFAEVDKCKRLYYEDESQAKKARENEEKIRKKRSGLLTKFTDLQAKKERTSAQREANDIQSTQARNDYIMALAACNAHLKHYFEKDLTQLMQAIDDGVLDHCKIFMASLSECDINSTRDTLTNAQIWSKMISLTNSQETNQIFLSSQQSQCLVNNNRNILLEPCNNDQILAVSLEFNADYALQYEIDKWLTWFKKECRKLNELMLQLETCQRAFAEGKKSIELNGQNTEDLESKILDLKQQITRSEAAKLKARARLSTIKEAGMQFDEWSTIEAEIRADAHRSQQTTSKQLSRDSPEIVGLSDRHQASNSSDSSVHQPQQGYTFESGNEQPLVSSGGGVVGTGAGGVTLQVLRDSDNSESGSNQYVTVSRSTTFNFKDQNNNSASTNYINNNDISASPWQTNFNSAWSVANSPKPNDANFSTFATNNNDSFQNETINQQHYNLLGLGKTQNAQSKNSMTVQSSSPLSAIIDGNQNTPSPNQQSVAEAYKSDYECDYNRNNQHLQQTNLNFSNGFRSNEQKDSSNSNQYIDEKYQYNTQSNGLEGDIDSYVTHLDTSLLNKQVIVVYAFDKTNDDEMSLVENEVLLVTAINDENWIKVRNLKTFQEGYIPKAYIRVLDEGEEYYQQNQEFDIKVEQYSASAASAQLESKGDSIDSTTYKTPMKQTNDTLFCHAIYDYIPTSDTNPDDDHFCLAFKQDEVFIILDQNSDDGWWLVERDFNGERGYVPSMLMEELEDGNNEGVYDDGDDGDASNEDELDCSRPMPAIAAPTIEPPKVDDKLNDINDTTDVQESVIDIKKVEASSMDSQANGIQQQQKDQKEDLSQKDFTNETSENFNDTATGVNSFVIPIVTEYKTPDNRPYRGHNHIDDYEEDSNAIKQD